MLVPGKIDHVGQLGMEHPGVQRQPQSGQPSQARPEIGAPIDVRPRCAIADDRIGVPVAGVAYAAEPTAAGSYLRLQYGLDPLAQCEIGITHDAGGDPRGPVAAAIAHRGDPSDKLGFANRAQFLRAGGAVHRVALQEHGCDHVVARSQVREQFVQQITMIWTVPEVMVCINNRQIRFQNRFSWRLAQPGLIRRVDPAEPGRCPGLDHAAPLPMHEGNP